jgi:hypothetical protein
MIKTGNTFIDAFSLIVVFSPLLPAAAIYMRKSFGSRVLNLLLTLCLLNFAAGICLTQIMEESSARDTAFHIFPLLETVILIYLFRSCFPARLQSLIQLAAIAFFSAATTYLLLERPEFRDQRIENVEHVLILLLASVVILRQMSSNDLRIFQSPMFWIAAGTVFYFFIMVLLESIQGSHRPGKVSVVQSVVLRNIATLIRYLLYLWGALVQVASNKRDTAD